MNDKSAFEGVSSCREINLFEIGKIQEIKEKNNIRDYTLVDFSTGFDGCVYLLFSKQPPDRIGGCFVDTRADTEYAAMMMVVDWSRGINAHTEFYDLGMHQMNYHFIRPLHQDILLVGSRCTYFNENNYEKNGIILGRDGAVKEAMCFGDGIQDVITDSRGRIITGYFDEGVLGNYGWKKPIGRSGLVVWNDKGMPVWENKEFAICDCYAMNLDSSDYLWFYYYTKFDLVRTDFKKYTVMHPNIQGSRGFAVSETRRSLFFQGGYRNEAFYCCDIHNFNDKKQISVKADGAEAKIAQFRFSGSRLLFLTEDDVLRGYYFLQ